MGKEISKPATGGGVHPAERIALFLLAVAYFLHAAWPSLVDPYVINNDAPQHLLWMYAADWADPFYAATSGLIQPWGYVGFNHFLLLFFSADTLTRYGPLLSLLLTVGYAHGLLRRYFGWGVALGGALLIGHLAYPPAVGYFSRAFCVPLLLIFAYYVTLERGAGTRRFGWRTGEWGTAAALLAAGLFYPPALLINGTILAGYFGRELARGDWHRASWSRRWGAWAAVALLAGGLVLAKTYQLRADPRVGDFVSAHAIRTEPEFGAGGRVNFVQELKTTTPAMLRYVLRKNLRWPGVPYTFYGAGLLWVVLAWRQRRRPVAQFDRWAFFLLASCCLWHYLAQVGVPRLFVPDRFLSYPGHLLAGLLVTRLIGGFALRRTRLWIQALALALLLLSGYHARSIRWESLTSYGNLRAVYAAVAELPPTAHLAAPPWVADMIPVFTHRSVLLSNESAHALYFTGYRRKITPRWRDFVSAYTAGPEQGALLRNFLRRYAITDLLIDEERLRARQFQAFQPYSDAYERATAARSPEDYLLLNLPARMGRRIDERYRLVSTAELLAWLAKDSGNRQGRTSR